MSRARNDTRSSASVAVLALILALAGLVLGTTNFLDRGTAATPPDANMPPPRSTTDAEQRIRDLEERLARLEQRPPAPNSSEPERAPASIPVDGTDYGAIIGQLSARVAKLELERQSAVRTATKLADPDGIPAALAVLLASRGVVTKVGDVEAIQANFPVLADLVRDPSAAEWSRLEAYRGLLMFPGGEELAVATLPDLASIVATSSDPAVRQRAASFMANLMNPSIAAPLMAAYYREPVVEVRGAILARLIQCRDDPSVRQTLSSIGETETDAELRGRVKRALAKKRDD